MGKDKSKKRSVRKPDRAKHISVINGPNLNLLGTRETELYGRLTLGEIETRMNALAEELGAVLVFKQSNHEGELIDTIHGLRESCGGIIINAAGLTHTSVSLRDALLAVDIPFVEVHLSNVYARERFRHRSLLADAAAGVICGFGALSYDLALRALVEQNSSGP